MLSNRLLCILGSFLVLIISTITNMAELEETRRREREFFDPADVKK